ncbi:hypothetical protein LINGRAHAP2_LOCUS2140 [Linum grandiflorum]
MKWFIDENGWPNARLSNLEDCFNLSFDKDKPQDNFSLVDSNEEDVFDEEDVFAESVLPDRPLPSCNWGCENKVNISLIINPISGSVESHGFHTRSQSISNPTNIRNTLLVLPVGIQACLGSPVQQRQRGLSGHQSKFRENAK